MYDMSGHRLGRVENNRTKRERERERERVKKKGLTGMRPLKGFTFVSACAKVGRHELLSFLKSVEFIFCFPSTHFFSPPQSARNFELRSSLIFFSSSSLPFRMFVVEWVARTHTHTYIHTHKPGQCYTFKPGGLGISLYTHSNRKKERCRLITTQYSGEKEFCYSFVSSSSSSIHRCHVLNE